MGLRGDEQKKKKENRMRKRLRHMATAGDEYKSSDTSPIQSQLTANITAINNLAAKFYFHSREYLQHITQVGKVSAIFVVVFNRRQNKIVFRYLFCAAGDT